MSYKELKQIYKQSKSRERTRSTMFYDDTDKADRRQQRRLTEKREIESALDNEIEAIDYDIDELD